MPQHLLSLLLVFFGLQTGFSQSIKGKITDEAGLPIAFASVKTSDLHYGVISDENGQFALQIPAGNYLLIIRHLGFEEQRLELEVPTAGELHIVLKAVDLELEAVEIEIGKRDPAYAIMKAVIANKKEYQKQFESYTCQTYLKASLEVDTLAKRSERRQMQDSLALDTLPEIYSERVTSKLIETKSETHFRYPGTYKSIVLAYQDYVHRGESKIQVSVGDEDTGVYDYSTDLHDPYMFYLDVSDAEFNFYDNLILARHLGDRPFISPLHNTLWQIIYKYKLVGTYYDKGRITYKIDIWPRNQDGPYFEGTIWVEDKSWALKAIELNVLPSTMSYFKEFKLTHKYERTQDERWILAQEIYDYHLKEGRRRYFGNTVAFHNDYQLDVEFPKNFFKNELRRTEKEAFEKDSAYWASIRPIQLKNIEQDFIQVQDSITAYHQSAEYIQKQDSIFNHLGIENFLFTGIQFRQREKGMTYFVSSLLEQMQWYGVGGYRHSLGGSVIKRWTRHKALNVSGNVNYGFKNEDVKGNVRVGFTYMPRKFGRAYVRFGDIYTLISEYETIGAFFSRGNFINKTYIGLGHHMEIINGLMLDVGVDFGDYKAIDQLELSQWSNQLFGDLNIPETFDPYREFLVDIRMKYTPGQKYQMEPYRKIIIGSRWPTFTFRYKKALPGVWGSRLNFDFFEIGAQQEVIMGSFGTSRWNVVAGRFIQANNARFTDYKFFRGSDRFFFASPLRHFQLLGPTISTKNEYLAGHYLHEFGGVLMDKLPLLKRTRLQATAGAGTLLIRDGNFLHSEVFAGVEYPFRIRKQRIKAGAWFVTAYSNYLAALDGQVKFGVTFFNPIKNRWEY